MPEHNDQPTIYHPVSDDPEIHRKLDEHRRRIIDFRTRVSTYEYATIELGLRPPPHMDGMRVNLSREDGVWHFYGPVPEPPQEEELPDARQLVSDDPQIHAKLNQHRDTRGTGITLEDYATTTLGLTRPPHRENTAIGLSYEYATGLYYWGFVPPLPQD